MPGGPPPSCSGPNAHDEDSHSSKLQIGLGTSSLDSTLKFDDDDKTEVDVEMNTVSLSASWRLNDKWSLRAGAGVILEGELTPKKSHKYEIDSGWMVSVGAEYLGYIGEDFIPTIDYSLFISTSASKIKDSVTDQESDYNSFDLRLGTRASWNLDDKLFPYVAARLFGGPVNWELNGEDVLGSDIHHYQVALGAAARFGKMSVFTEWAGIGEKSLSAGLSYSF